MPFHIFGSDSSDAIGFYVFVVSASRMYTASFHCVDRFCSSASRVFEGASLALAVSFAARVETSADAPLPRDHARFPWRPTPAQEAARQYQLDHQGNYVFSGPVDAMTILSVAEQIREARFFRETTLTHPSAANDFLVAKLGLLEHEVFAAIFLDSRHAILAFEILFNGSLTGASVYPREVVKRALQHNAAAVIFSHNHPSGVPEPSHADRDITTELQRALRLVEVRVLDHIIVGGNKTTSLAQRGLL